ncbi:MAG: carboxymuconolactone decarboxylase family protein [Emcibacteraceae bacterium]|nr:carboxymuconolactone decarboxylase family protein [Emcibacteraceae bacterium]
MTDENMTKLFDEGMKIRRSVLGDDYVDNAISNMDDFSAPLQELVTEFCWGSIWTRDGLDKRTRSLLNIAMLSALNRPHEIKIHLKGAIRNGCTPEEIREVILQIAVYCGVPAAIDTMKMARQILTEENKLNDAK